MNRTLGFEWEIPKDYVKYMESLLPSSSLFKKCTKLLFSEEKGTGTPHVVVNDFGITSNWKTKVLIRYETIFGVTFSHEKIEQKTYLMMRVAHYEDQNKLIPDESLFVLTYEVNISNLSKYLSEKGIKVVMETRTR
jgi:hypothetical protein